MAIVPSAFAASGPQDIIPVPVKYEIFMEEYFPKVDGSDVRVHLGDKRFLKEINSLNIPEFARNEAYKLAVGKKRHRYFRRFRSWCLSREDKPWDDDG